MKKLILKLLQNYLSILARLYLSKTKPIVVWITWSVGKTSCRVIINQILSKFLIDKKVYSSPKNFNSEIWLPFSIFEVENYKPNIFNLLKTCIFISFTAFFSKPSYDVIILEYWLDYAYMDLLLKSARPDIAIFTRLDSIHLEFFDSVEKIWFEKFKLIHAARKKAYLNYKDHFARTQFDKIKVEKSYYSWKYIKAKNYDLIKEETSNCHSGLDSESFGEKKLWYKKDPESSSKWQYTILAKFETWNKIIKTNLLWEENSEYIALAFDILKEIENNTHEMKLQDYHFNEILNWNKKYEFRLFDDKRKKIKPWDKILFSKIGENDKCIEVNVINIYVENDFKSLFDYLKLKSHENMYDYYSQEDEKKYWVIAIKIEELGKEEVYLDLKLQSWRFRIFSWIKDSVLIDSSYNAGPESMKIMIENTFILRRKIYPDYKVALVLWEMRELGKDTEKAHKNLVNCINGAFIIFTIWKDMEKYFLKEMKKSDKKPLLKSFISSRQAWISLKKILETDDKNYIILFKWSQNTIFTEEALKEVLENKDDKKYLVRQSDFWTKKKEEFFNSLINEN